HRGRRLGLLSLAGLDAVVRQAPFGYGAIPVTNEESLHWHGDSLHTTVRRDSDVWLVCLSQPNRLLALCRGEAHRTSPKNDQLLIRMEVALATITNFFGITGDVPFVELDVDSDNRQFLDLSAVRRCPESSWRETA